MGDTTYGSLGAVSRPQRLPVYTGTGRPAVLSENLAPENGNTAGSSDTITILNSVPSGSNVSQGYEEFFGGAISCPTCHGTGKVPRDLENELVALIPVSDKRLRPRRTVLYVIIAVLTCVVIGGLLLFFLFPRSVVLKSNDDILIPYYIDSNDTKKLTLTLTKAYNVSNSNYFSVDVTSLELRVLLTKKTILVSATNSTALKVPMRSVRVHYVVVNMTFTDEYIVNSCRHVSGRIILMPFQATGTFYYFDREEQYSLNTYQYIRCHPADIKHPD